MSSLLEYDCFVRTPLDASRFAMGVGGAKFTLLHDSLFIGHERTIGTGHDAGVAADTFTCINDNEAVNLAERPGDAALHTQRFIAMPAVYRKADPILLFDLDTGIDGSVFESLDHAFLSRVCIRAVVFTKVAAEAPLFIDINSFHLLPPIALHGRCRESVVQSR